jgi:hypothetical protein
MKTRKVTKFGMIFLLSILLIGLVSAAATYCCEKTVDGALCQNAAEDQCDIEFRKAPTSCESTSYCRKGCCYNGAEGTCMENTPQSVCQQNGGLWAEDADCNIPQCELGCCLIGDQASFVTKVRCKRLSTLYGLETNFLVNIGNEVECIQQITSDIEGACVFEKDFERTCLRKTQRECLQIKERQEGVEFYEGMLCSADELDTNCDLSTKTTCVEGEDPVYFLDTCGNVANVYDSSKVNSDGLTTSDPDYWAKIKDVRDSCGYGDSNANSPDCGNCDYYLGSTCKEFERSPGVTAPDFGDNICKDLGCSWANQDWEHGESWCVTDPKSRPGSRDFRMLCYNGEIIEEPCADFRAEVCIEDSVPAEVTGGDEFSVAACRVNRWQDCAAQNEKDDCENSDIRDCKWLGKSDLAEQILKNKGGVSGICVPLNAPGFDFWEGDSDAEKICKMGDQQCVVEYVRKYEGAESGIGLGGVVSVIKDILGGDGKTDWEVKKGGQCLTQAWKNEAELLCSSLGDCGSSVNYLDIKGYYSLGDLYDLSSKLDAEELEDELKK